MDLLPRFMLALCVWREARGETPLGRRLVAQVIVNRSRDPKHRWPQTITGVVVQPYQFSSFNRMDPNAGKWPEEADSVWAECVAAADAVLAASTTLTTANHYHVIGLDPVWRRDDRIVNREGHHVFYDL